MQRCRTVSSKGVQSHRDPRKIPLDSGQVGFDDVLHRNLPIARGINQLAVLSDEEINTVSFEILVRQGVLGFQLALDVIDCPSNLR